MTIGENKRRLVREKSGVGICLTSFVYSVVVGQSFVPNICCCDHVILPELPEGEHTCTYIRYMIVKAV